MARGRRSNSSRSAAKPPPKKVEEDEEEDEIEEEDISTTNGTNGFVTKDQVGDVDMEEEDLEEIELSSDEEDEDADVALVVMKRPPVTSRTVDMLELGDDEDEGPVLAGVKKAGINTREKEGFVKEYIETEGLGVLFTRDFGLVLFHLETVWLEGKQQPPGRTREMLEAGDEVKFLDQCFEDEEYKELSHDGVIHQAVAVWTGDRPEHLLKKVTEDGYKAKLEEHRKAFMLYLRGEVFLRAALVRVKGEMAGYLSDTIGIVDYKDGEDTKHIFFHVDDVVLFKKPIKEYKKPIKQLLPVGVTLSVDARRVHISGVKNIDYQAVSVVIGGWPTTPHPTLLPGGQGSEAPSYEIPDDGTYTFYYLELALEAKLQRKVNQLKEVLKKSKGEIKYDWKDTTTIADGKEAVQWRAQFVGRKRFGKRAEEDHKKEVFHAFRAAGEGDLKEEELVKMEGATKTTKQVQERTWYSQEAWEHGGLRIKDEVKAESGASPTKRLKKE